MKRNIKPVAKKAAPTRSQSTAHRVALIGFGTVGRAVAKILCENIDPSLRLTHICNRNIERKKQDWVPSSVTWTDDVQAVLKSDVEIVIELIGGLSPAEQIVRTALEVRKIGGHGQQAIDCASWTGPAGACSSQRGPAGIWCIGGGRGSRASRAAHGVVRRPAARNRWES